MHMFNFFKNIKLVLNYLNSLILFYLCFILLISCAGFDTIDDINSFVSKDLAVGFTGLNISNQVIDSSTESNPIELQLGQTFQINITDIRNTEANRDISQNVIWTSSDNNLATVVNGAVTIQNQNFGAFYIEAENANDPNAVISVGKWFFEVVNFERIVITSSTGTNALIVGDVLALTATYFDMISIETNVDITWSSSTPLVATIDQNGLVTGLTSGSTTITSSTIRDGNTITQTKLINVIDDNARINISSDNGSNEVIIGNTLLLTAVYTNRLGNEVAADITWTSSNTNVATINQTGLITAISEGIITITASVTDGNNTVIGEEIINIIDTNNARISISSDNGSNEVIIGNTLLLTAVYIDRSGNQVAVDITWTSSNTNVATINQSGLITAISQGATTITALTVLEGGTVSSARVINSINDPNQVAEIVINDGENNIMVGEMFTLQATARNISGDNLDNITFSWISDDNSIITINNNGLVTGISIGETAIRASYKDISSEDFIIAVEAAFISQKRIGTYISGRGTSTSGTLTLSESSGSSLTLRLNDDFTGAGIPGPVLFLSNSPQVTAASSRIGQVISGDVSSHNNQTFNISNVGLEDYDYVIYHCEPYNIVYGVFELGVVE